MKQLLILLGVLALLTSCQHTGIKNPIKQRYLSHDFTFIHGGDSLPVYANEDKYGMTFVLLPAEKDPNTKLKYDSVYTVERTWGQAFYVGLHDWTVVIFIIGLLGTIGGLALAVYKMQQGTRSSQDRSVLAWIIIPFIFFIIMCNAFIWDKWGSEREILKSEYITSPDLDAYWLTTPKIY